MNIIKRVSVTIGFIAFGKFVWTPFISICTNMSIHENHFSGNVEFPLNALLTFTLLRLKQKLALYSQKRKLYEIFLYSFKSKGTQNLRF